MTQQKSSPLTATTSLSLSRSDQPQLSDQSQWSGRRVRASNGTLATATLLGTFPAAKRIVRDSVGRGNPVDFFRIELTETSRIKLNFINRSEVRLSAALLDANGAVISTRGRRQQFNTPAREKANILLRGAAPGVYYVRIKGAANGRNNYDFSLFANRSSDSAPLPCGCGN